MLLFDEADVVLVRRVPARRVVQRVEKVRFPAFGVDDLFPERKGHTRFLRI